MESAFYRNRGGKKLFVFVLYKGKEKATSNWH